MGSAGWLLEGSASLTLTSTKYLSSSSSSDASPASLIWGWQSSQNSNAKKICKPNVKIIQMPVVKRTGGKDYRRP